MGAFLLDEQLRARGLRSRSGLVLGILLLLLLAAAVVLPRDANRLAPRELTYLLAGYSLAHDRDFVFSEADRSRLAGLSISEVEPALRSRAAGPPEFDVPSPYPLLLAPAVALAPLRGPAILNALLVAVAALLLVGRLGRRLGASGAALVTACFFASVFYRNVFLVQPTILLTVLTAVVFSLILRHQEPGAHGLDEVYRPLESRTVGIRWGLLAGALLGLAVIHDPWLALLVVPAGVAIPARRRGLEVASLLAGLVAVVAIAGMLQGLVTGDWQDWIAAGSESWRTLAVGTSTWNLFYAAVGRNTGLLPYLLPWIALLGLWQGGTGRSALVVTVLVGLVIPLLWRPFDYFGGPAAVGNILALPWLVLLLYVPQRPVPRGLLPALWLLAVPFMYPTWLALEIEPVTQAGIYRHRAGSWHRWLPLETTQQNLPPGLELASGRLRIRSLSLEARPGGGSHWQLAGDGWAELQLATPVPLAAVYLQFGSAAEPDLEVRGGDLGDMVLLADGGIGFRIENLSRKALHPVWWSEDRHYNYVLEFSMPEAAARAQSLVVTALAENLTDRQP